jgi:hypothetical protein
MENIKPTKLQKSKNNEKKIKMEKETNKYWFSENSLKSNKYSPREKYKKKRNKK